MALDTLHNARLDPELKALADVPLSRLISDPAATLNADWNTLTEPGYVSGLMYGGHTNGPGDTNYYYVEVRRFAGTELVQIGYQYYLNAPGNTPSMIIRHRYTGAWGAWRRVYASQDKPSCRVRSQHSAGLGPSGDQVWTSVLTNNGSCYSTSTGRFTAPVTGIYVWQSTVLSRVNAALSTWLKHNGTYIAYEENSRSGSYGASSINMQIFLSAGDYLQLYCHHDHYGSNTYSWFSCSLL